MYFLLQQNKQPGIAVGITEELSLASESSRPNLGSCVMNRHFPAAPSCSPHAPKFVFRPSPHRALPLASHGRLEVTQDIVNHLSIQQSV